MYNFELYWYLADTERFSSSLSLFIDFISLNIGFKVYKHNLVHPCRLDPLLMATCNVNNTCARMWRKRVFIFKKYFQVCICCRSKQMSKANQIVYFPTHVRANFWVTIYCKYIDLKTDVCSISVSQITASINSRQIENKIAYFSACNTKNLVFVSCLSNTHILRIMHTFWQIVIAVFFGSTQMK